MQVAVASGIGNARHLLESMARGEAEYDFVEVRWGGVGWQDLLGL